MTEPTKKWKKIGQRCYEFRTASAQAFVFGAYRPISLWAFSVYWKNGNFSRVENGFSEAKRRVEQTIKELEAAND